MYQQYQPYTSNYYTTDYNQPMTQVSQFNYQNSTASSTMILPLEQQPLNYGEAVVDFLYKKQYSTFIYFCSEDDFRERSLASDRPLLFPPPQLRHSQSHEISGDCQRRFLDSRYREQCADVLSQL